MLEIFYDKNNLILQNHTKKHVKFDTKTDKVFLEDFDVSHPGEYEKFGVLLEVKEYNDILFYKLLIEGKHVCIVTVDKFELKEEILSFFWDVDVLIIVGTKDAVKVFENIEAKVVIPYTDGKDVFLNTLSQHGEEVSKFKSAGEIPGDITQFINLK